MDILFDDLQPRYVSAHAEIVTALIDIASHDEYRIEYVSLSVISSVEHELLPGNTERGKS